MRKCWEKDTERPTAKTICEKFDEWLDDKNILSKLSTFKPVLKNSLSELSTFKPVLKNSDDYYAKLSRGGSRYIPQIDSVSR
ncbi:12362_t:CDS:1, partial [Cetraspora pellucida]